MTRAEGLRSLVHSKTTFHVTSRYHHTTSFSGAAVFLCELYAFIALISRSQLVIVLISHLLVTRNVRKLLSKAQLQAMDAALFLSCCVCRHKTYSRGMKGICRVMFRRVLLRHMKCQVFVAKTRSLRIPLWPERHAFSRMKRNKFEK